MLELIIRGSSIGFAAGSIPGPLHTYLINETLIGGWRRSLVIAFSPLITDGPIILLIVFLLGQLPESVIATIQIAGGLFIWRLAYEAWRKLAQATIILTDDLAPGSRQQTLGRALIVNWLNPGPYVFWASVNGPLLLKGLEKSPLHALAFLISFYGMLVGLMIGVALIFHQMRRLDQSLIRGMLWLTVILLMLLGTSFIWQGVTQLR